MKNVFSYLLYAIAEAVQLSLEENPPELIKQFVLDGADHTIMLAQNPSDLCLDEVCGLIDRTAAFRNLLSRSAPAGWEFDPSAQDFWKTKALKLLNKALAPFEGWIEASNQKEQQKAPDSSVQRELGGISEFLTKIREATNSCSSPEEVAAITSKLAKEFGIDCHIVVAPFPG